MNSSIFENTLQSLKFQRNVFLGMSTLLVLGIIILSSFLFYKSERVIISPPVIEKEFWIESKNVSPTYLEQFGLFLGQLILGKSSQSAASQRNVVLRHVDPSFSGPLKQKLIEEEEILSKQNASYIFFPIDIQAIPSDKSLILLGDRQLYVNGKLVSSSRENYTLKFNYSGSRLLLSGISSEQKGG